MSTDSINEEILRIKRELAAKFDNDLARIVADAKTREQAPVTLPPRKWTAGRSDAPKPPSNPLPGGPLVPAGG